MPYLYIEKYSKGRKGRKLTLKIKDLPEGERPYEKLELKGEKNLSNAELLAIIIKTGTKEQTSVEIAKQILKINQNEKKDDLSFLQEISIEELTKIKGIGRVKAIQIKAVAEIGMRMTTPTNYKKITIKEPEDVAKILMNELRNEKQEKVKVIILNSKEVIQKILEVSKGGTNFAKIEIKAILSEAVKMQAPKIILVHNHPSGDSNPSKKDFEITEKLAKAANLLGIELVDHIVIGNMEYTSIKQYLEFEKKIKKGRET